MALKQGAQGLAFTSDLHEGRDADVLLSAGALQYVDTTLPDLLAGMGCRPAHIIVNKLPLYEGPTFVTVQSTGRAFIPIWRLFNRTEFVEGIVAQGYRVVDDWQNSEVRCHVPMARNRSVDAYSGYFFRAPAGRTLSSGAIRPIHSSPAPECSEHARDQRPAFARRCARTARTAG